jgi:hypothetical protein
MAAAIISGGRAFRTATPVFSIPQWSLFVGGAFAPNRRPEGNSGHLEGGAFHPEPLLLDPAMVAAEAAPTGGLLFVGGALAPNQRPRGNSDHWEGGAFYPKPLLLDPAAVAAEAAPAD